MLTVPDQVRSHPAMISIDIDHSRQLLIIRFEKIVSVEEATSEVETINCGLQELRTGFHLLTDLSNLEYMEDGCAPILMQIMDICSRKGIKSVYRIMPDPTKDIGFNIMSLFHYGRHVRIVTFESKEEAEGYLRNLGRQERK